MDAEKLEGARAKLNRAEEQLGELRMQFDAGWKQNLYGIRTRDDLDGHQTVITALKPRPVFARYSVIVGEIVHEMRSALDHIIWQMVPSPRDGVTGFPVFTLEKKDPSQPRRSFYENRGLQMIDGIDPLAEQLIRKLQPFATGPDQRLALLNEMWNWGQAPPTKHDGGVTASALAVVSLP